MAGRTAALLVGDLLLRVIRGGGVAVSGLAQVDMFAFISRLLLNWKFQEVVKLLGQARVTLVRVGSKVGKTIHLAGKTIHLLGQSLTE